MNTLRELAGYVSEPKLFQKHRKTSSRIILFSIHQPTSDIFHLFTNIILMSAGRIIFHGTVHEAHTLFNSMGMICPLLYNPAEFYVNHISDPNVAAEILSHAGDKEIDNENQQQFSNSFDEKETIRNGEKVSWLRQVVLLSHRGALNFLHDPRHYLIELLILLVSYLLRLHENHQMIHYRNYQLRSKSSARVVSKLRNTLLVFLILMMSNNMPVKRSLKKLNTCYQNHTTRYVICRWPKYCLKMWPHLIRLWVQQMFLSLSFDGISSFSYLLWW